MTWTNGQQWEQHNSQSSPKLRAVCIPFAEMIVYRAKVGF
uniref:Uncharacterized protein n=1 Tax=Anguilla anguilla TaxID=7936 RepID=A0A0E9WQ51_ANGAN